MNKYTQNIRYKSVQEKYLTYNKNANNEYFTVLNKTNNY